MGSINVAITVSALTKIIPHPEDAECTTHTVFDGELRWRLEAGGHMLFAYSCDKFVVHGEIAEVVETFDLYGEDVDRFMITLRSIDEQCAEDDVSIQHVHLGSAELYTLWGTSTLGKEKSK